jgi:O-antigen ligase
VVVGAILFGFGSLISAVTAPDRGEAVLATAQFLYLTLAWFWLGTALLSTPRRISIAMMFWVGSVAVSGAWAIAQIRGLAPAGESLYGRYVGLTAHVNDQGALSAVALVPALMLATTPYRTIVGRLLGVAALTLVGAGLLFSGSLGGMFAAACGVVVWMVAGRRTGRTLVLGVAILAILAVGDQTLGQGVTSPGERLEEIAAPPGDPSNTAFTREAATRAAWRSISDDPLIGVGANRAGALTETGSAVHNVFLKAWYESGLFGLLGMGLILGGVALEGVRAVRSADRSTHALAVGVLGGYTAFVVSAMLAPVLFQRYGWVSAALVLALRAAQTRGYGRITAPVIPRPVAAPGSRSLSSA